MFDLVFAPFSWEHILTLISGVIVYSVGVLSGAMLGATSPNRTKAVIRKVLLVKDKLQ